MRLNILLILTSVLLFSSCSKEETVAEIRDRNKAEILDYLSENNISAIEAEGDLFVFIEEEGSSQKPNILNTITINYKGYDKNGAIFDQSSSPIQFPLANLITGWQIGIPYFGKGGKGTLFVPSHLAYGSRSPSNNNFIIFDIELIDF